MGEPTTVLCEELPPRESESGQAHLKTRGGKKVPQRTVVLVPGIEKLFGKRNIRT